MGATVRSSLPSISPGAWFGSGASGSGSDAAFGAADYSAGRRIHGSAMIVAGLQGGKITLNFAFDVSPEDLQSPVEVILIDGDGNKHQHKADLKGILEIN